MATEPMWLRMHVGPTAKDGHTISACTDPTHWVPVEKVVPVFRMGGLSPAFYITDDESEADAYLVEVSDGD